MLFLLVRKDGDEYIELADVTRIIVDGDQLNRKRNKRWTFVNTIRRATMFDSERLVEMAKDKFCRFPWIKYRLATTEEITEHGRTDTKHRTNKPYGPTS